MSLFDRAKQTWADKAAVLGLLIAGLVIAHIISVRRSALNFSEPVELDHMGVQMVMPVGNGWQSDVRWVYVGNKFVLSSFFSLGDSNPTVVARCRYLLAAMDTSPEAQIQEKAFAAGGTISEEGSFSGGPVGVEWVRMKTAAAESRVAFDMLFGSAELPNGRVINIEVRWSSADEQEMAKEVFERMAAGLKFKGSPLLDCGITTLDRMKSKGFSQLLTGWNAQDYFVIKGTNGQPLGYVIEILADLGSQASMNIQAASSFYLRGRHGREEVIIFQGRDDLSEFSYKSETASRFGRSGTEGVLDDAGILSVKEYGTSTFGGSPADAEVEPAEERFYRLGAASIPDVLAQLVYRDVLAGNCERVMMDVVRPDGTIVPVVVSRPESRQEGAGKKGGYMLKLDFLDGRESFSEVYLDEERVILKEVLRDGAIYILERSSAEELRKLFPEKANEILQGAAREKI